MSENVSALSLRDLDDRELAYVKARADTASEAEACRVAGIVERTFYRWPEKRRKQLLELAIEYKRDATARALQILQDAVAEAAEVKARGLKSRKEHIAQGAADSILDRMMGKATQRQEITGAGGKKLFDMQELVAALQEADRLHGDDQS